MKILNQFTNYVSLSFKKYLFQLNELVNSWEFPFNSKVHCSCGSSYKLVRYFYRLVGSKYFRRIDKFCWEKELFNPLTGWFFRILGGAPIDRSGNKDSVESIAAVFEAHEKFRLALAPEGTRGKVDKLRTGYYYIAKRLKIPIIPVSFDYENKKVIVY